MPPKLRAKDGRHLVIRPLAYVKEADLARYAELRRFPIIPCDLCGSQADLKRKQVKTVLREWEQRFPGCGDSLFAALANVLPSHLMDRRLFDFAALPAALPEVKSVALDENEPAVLTADVGLAPGNPCPMSYPERDERRTVDSEEKEEAGRRRRTRSLPEHTPAP